jgi:hypothetical protein
MRWTTGLETLLAAMCAVLLTFLAAELSYRLVELGGQRRHIATAYPRKLILGLGALAVGTSATAATAALKLQRELSLSRTARGTDWYPDYSKPLGRSRPRCAVEEHYEPLGTGTIRSWVPRCGGSGETKHLFVVGDSHALAYIPLLGRFAADTGSEVRLYHLSGCPFLNLREPLGRNPGCEEYYGDVVAALSRDSRRGDVVFLASLKMPRLSNQSGSQEPDGSAQEDAQGAYDAAREAFRFARSMNPKAVQIVFEGPKPVFRSPPYRCSDWFNKSNPVCAGGFAIPRSDLEPARQQTLMPMYEIASLQPNVHVWDPFPALCPADVCYAFRAGRPLFFDADHISGYANEFLYPAFRHAIEGSFHSAPSTTSTGSRSQGS